MSEPTPTGADERTALERAAWRLVGPPLYYCEHCLRRVEVSADNVVTRTCEHHDARIMAPRKSILAGAGGLSTFNKARMAWWQAAAKVTGRSV